MSREDRLGEQRGQARGTEEGSCTDVAGCGAGGGEGSQTGRKSDIATEGPARAQTPRVREKHHLSEHTQGAHVAGVELSWEQEREDELQKAAWKQMRAFPGGRLRGGDVIFQLVVCMQWGGMGAHDHSQDVWGVTGAWGEDTLRMRRT